MRRSLLQTVVAWFAVVPWLGGKALASSASQAEEAEEELDISQSNLMLVSLDEKELAERKIGWLDIGEVVIPSGRIRVSDPLAYPDFPPLERDVAPGRYPVRLYTAFDRVAVATLRIADGTPAIWEAAEHDGTGPYKSMPKIGFAVDAGMGAFSDAGALEQVNRRIAATAERTGRKGVNYYDDVTAQEIDANGGEWALHQPMPDNDLNVAMFHSGWGDGYYPFYWGLSEEGKPLILLTDLLVIENADGRKEPE